MSTKAIGDMDDLTKQMREMSTEKKMIEKPSEDDFCELKNTTLDDIRNFQVTANDPNPKSNTVSDTDAALVLDVQIKTAEPLSVDDKGQNKSAVEDLDNFWASKKHSLKPTQIEKYIQAKADLGIISLIERGSSKGFVCEAFARFKFRSLCKRTGGGKNSGYDHIHEPSGNEGEQKTSGNWDKADHSWKWQHIEPKHPWKYLLFCGIGYKDIHWFFLSRKNFNVLCDKKIITRQGDNEKNSYQGWWLNYKKAKNDLIEVEDNDHLDTLLSMI